MKVKHLGRTWEKYGVIWLGLSATGVEFVFTGKKLEITLLGDSRVEEQGEDPLTDKARIAIEVGDKRILSFCMTEKEKDIVLLDSETEQTVCVRILKISEAAMSVVGIKRIHGDATSKIVPTENKKVRIEVIGDSITCGYGIDDPVKEHAFQTKTEDATKAYAYKTAKMLDADYSLVSYSGYGIVSGYTADVVRNVKETLPQYYDKVAYSLGALSDGTLPSDILWDFSRFIPDLIVINLGTNDDSYCLCDSKRQNQYKEAYQEFLKQVRVKNPTAKILCILGLMGDNLYESLEAAVNSYQLETKDDKVSCMHITPQKEEDGYSADFHPSVQSQNRLAQELCEKIRELI